VKQFLIIGVLLTSICLSGCKEEEKKPTLPEEQLIQLLYDVQVAEAALRSVHTQDKDSLSQIYYQEVYERHAIHEQDLVDNLNILKENPKLTNKIYKKVLDFHNEKVKERKASAKPK